MGGRGTFEAGNSVDYTYQTVGFIEDVKVLHGLNGNTVCLKKHIQEVLISS